VHPLHKPTRKPTGRKPRDCPPKAARHPQEDCCPHWVPQRLRCILMLPVCLSTRLLVQVVAHKSQENKKKEKKPHGGYVVCAQQINCPAVLCRLCKLSNELEVNCSSVRTGSVFHDGVTWHPWCDMSITYQESPTPTFRMQSFLSLLSPLNIHQLMQFIFSIKLAFHA